MGTQVAEHQRRSPLVAKFLEVLFPPFFLFSFPLFYNLHGYISYMIKRWKVKKGVQKRGFSA